MSKPQPEYDLTPLTSSQIEEKAKTLSGEEKRVLLHHGTEPAFCGGLLNEKGEGCFCCKLCDLPLFSSEAKFESGTGWPSFFAPFRKEHIAYIQDNSHGMMRTEIRCARCQSHLGHVFPDGPPPTRLRYCLNSIAMKFEADQ
jgi:peptide-methionine (R)-S-oxide reductase